jgi:hypothetical protein
VGKVTVYYFNAYDSANDRFVPSRRPATLEAIKKAAGTPIQSTAQEVEESEIDALGFRQR